MITKAAGPRGCDAVRVNRAATVPVRAPGAARLINLPDASRCATAVRIRRWRLSARLAAVRETVRLGATRPMWAATAVAAHGNPDAWRLWSGTDEALRTQN